MTPTQLRAFAAGWCGSGRSRTPPPSWRSPSRAGCPSTSDSCARSSAINCSTVRRRAWPSRRAGCGWPGGPVSCSVMQDRTIVEVGEAARGKRTLRLAASSMFAEYGAPGLIELFASRAADLDVELSVRNPTQFSTLLLTRTADIAIGPGPTGPRRHGGQQTDHEPADRAGGRARPPAGRRQPDAASAARADLAAGPVGRRRPGRGAGHAAPDGGTGGTPADLPEPRGRRSRRPSATRVVAPVLSYAVAQDLARRNLIRLTGPQTHLDSVWHAAMLTGQANSTGGGRAGPVRRHPRAGSRRWSAAAASASATSSRPSTSLCGADTPRSSGDEEDLAGESALLGPP